jgi:hypothetical protein
MDMTQNAAQATVRDAMQNTLKMSRRLACFTHTAPILEKSLELYLNI